MSARTAPIPSTIRTSLAPWRKSVARGEADAGIVIDGAGLGSAIAANKIRGVRAAMCTTRRWRDTAREHNGANVLALGATLVPAAEAALRIVDVWLGTPMREARYLRRLLKIRRLEERSDGRAPVDLARLIAIVAEEVMAASRRRRADALRLPLGAGGLLSDAAAGRHRRRRDAASASTRPAARRAAWRG